MKKDDISQVTSKRDELSNRLKERYPDKDFTDDDIFYGQIGEDMDSYAKELSDYQEREQALSDMLTSDPRSANFITDWRRGEDPVIGLVRRFGSEIKDAIDDPKLQDQLAKANKEYVERVEQSKALEAEYQKNIAETLSYLDGLSKDGVLAESDIDDAMALLTSIVHDGIVGKFSPESIDMAVKALHHDSDVEEANIEGEVRGKNTKIEEKLRKRHRGDGLAQLDGQNNPGGVRSEQPHLGALDRYDGGNQTIWERGGEKRTRAV